MSFAAQAQLQDDLAFSSRSRSSAIQQAGIFLNDDRPDIAALGRAVLRDEAWTTPAFVRLIANFPGVVDGATDPDGTVDQSKVTDADILSHTQANWPTIAGIYYDADGTWRP